MDSFISIDNNITDDEDASKRVETLRYALKQRDSMRTKLLSELRLAENHTSTNQLYNSLLNELQSCDNEIQQLKVAYVEALMELDEIKSILKKDKFRGTDEEIDFINKEIDSSIENRTLPSKLLTSDYLEHLDIKKRNLRDSIFKYVPTKITKNFGNREAVKGGNKELLFARVNISSIHIDISCSSSHIKNIRPHFSSNISKDEVSILYLKISGINLKAKHRTMDSKVRT
jgi:hypothetical protein